MSWATIFPDLDEPVRGSVAEYDHARERAQSVGLAVSTLSSGIDLEGLRGSTADALRAVVDNIDGSFADLPPVLASLEQAFANHAAALAGLQAAAAEALARASLRRATATQAHSALAAIQNQIRAATDPAELDLLAARRQQATIRCDDADAALDASRAEHTGLAESEQELVWQTCAALGDIALGDLKDPGRLQQIAQAVGGFVADWTVGAVVDIVEGVVAATVALADGRFLDVLHHLSDTLDGVLRLAAVIAVAVVVVGSPGGLAMLPAIIGATQQLSVAQVAIDTVLLATQHPHPETGRPVGIVEVLAGAAGAMVGSRLPAPAMQSQAIAAAGGTGTFVRTAAQNQAIVTAVAAGERQVLNVVTGNVVSGAALTAMTDRAAVELGAYAVQDAIAATVADAGGGVVEDLAEAGLRQGLEWIDPEAEATLNGVTYGPQAAALEAIADQLRRLHHVQLAGA